MNADRRKRLQDTMSKINEGLAGLIEEITAVADEEEEAFQNLSENLQGGEKGQKMEETATQLRDAADELEQARNALDTCVEEACQ